MLGTPAPGDEPATTAGAQVAATLYKSVEGHVPAMTPEKFLMPANKN